MAQHRADIRESGERGRDEARYRRIFTHAPAVIYALDFEGRITELNPAGEDVLARPASAVLGRHFGEFIARSDVEELQRLSRAVRAGEISVMEWEAHLLRPDGSRRLVHFRTVPIVENGQVSGSFGVGTDITRSREDERASVRTAGMATLGALISGVAHQLNNPLNAIRNFAELMLLEPRSEDDREGLEIIRREADRATGIVRDLRAVGRQTSTDGAEQPVDLNQVVGHVRQLREYSLGDERIEVVERLEPGLPPVHANPAQLEQALLQLLVNAEEAVTGTGTEGGAERRIEIRTYRADSGVRLEIEDSGSGIPPEIMERVFEPFWTTKRPGEGAGLGLSLARRIIMESGGDVRADRGAGGGAVFTVNLPTAADAPEPEASETHAAAHRTLRVLVVDDEDSLRRAIGRYLERRGHRADQAATADEAIQAVTSGVRYDALLTDLRLPGGGGTAIVDRLAGVDPSLVDRVVAITGDADCGEPAGPLASRGVPVLVKPVGLDTIVGVLEERAERYARTHHPQER